MRRAGAPRRYMTKALRRSPAQANDSTAANIISPIFSTDRLATWPRARRTCGKADMYIERPAVLCRYTTEALKRSPALARDAADADVILVNDYCYKLRWLAFVHAEGLLPQLQTEADEVAAGETLVEVRSVLRGKEDSLPMRWLGVVKLPGAGTPLFAFHAHPCLV